MPRSLAFLRGINLGKRRVTMRVLVDAITALGFTAVSTHLASGNVVFTHARASARSLEGRFEKGLEEALGYPVDTHVRSEDEVRDLCLQAPVAEGPAALARGSLYVVFFKDLLTAEQRRGLARASSSTDAFTPRARETYWRSAIPFHESKVWTSPALKSLALPPMTLRGFPTVQGVVATLRSRNPSSPR